MWNTYINWTFQGLVEVEWGILGFLRAMSAKKKVDKEGDYFVGGRSLSQIPSRSM